MKSISDGISCKSHTQKRSKVLIVAPFSLKGSWTERTWPFLVYLRQLFGEANVGFFGSGQWGVKVFDTWLNRLKYRWWPTIRILFYVARRLREYDAVVAWYSAELMYGISLVLALTPVRTRVKIVWLGLAVGQQKRGFKAQVRRQVTRFVLRWTDLVICNSKGQVEQLNRRYPHVANRSACVHYGGPIQTPASAYEASKAEDRGYIFSGGFANRDYSTLVSAVRELPCPVKIVTRCRDSLDADLPDHIECYENIPFEQFSHLLAQSAFVVIPLRDPNVSSGQLVLLQAMEMRKAVVITDFRGADDYVRDGQDALLVRPGVAEDLKSKIKTLLADRRLRDKIAQNGHLSFQTKFGWKNYAEGIGGLIQTALEHVDR